MIFAQNIFVQKTFNFVIDVMQIIYQMAPRVLEMANGRTEYNQKYSHRNKYW